MLPKKGSKGFFITLLILISPIIQNCSDFKTSESLNKNKLSFASGFILQNPTVASSSTPAVDRTPDITPSLNDPSRTEPQTGNSNPSMNPVQGMNCATDPSQVNCKIKSVVLEVNAYKPRGELAAPISAPSRLEVQYYFDAPPSATRVLVCDGGCSVATDGTVIAMSGSRFAVQYDFELIAPQYYNLYISQWVNLIDPILIYSDGSWGIPLVNGSGLPITKIDDESMGTRFIEPTSSCGGNVIDEDSLPFIPSGPTIMIPHCMYSYEMSGGNRQPQGYIVFEGLGVQLIPNARSLPKMPVSQKNG